MVKATSYLAATLVTSASAAAVIREPTVYALAPTGDAEFTPSNNSEIYYYGGAAVAHKDYPTMIAALRAGGHRPQGQSCSASVIGPRKILIAAHCHDVSGTKTFAYGHDDLNKGTITKIEVVSYKKHPKYQNFDQGYDVAVVTTKTDIPVKGGVYAKFATSADKGKATGKTAYGLGYGRKDVNDNQKNVELHLAKNIPIVAAKTCDETGQGLKVKDDTMICAGYPTGRPVTSLPGDSGGPLYVDGKIFGLCSWSKSTSDWYGIYARLDNEMGDWVAQELKN